MVQLEAVHQANKLLCPMRPGVWYISLKKLKHNLSVLFYVLYRCFQITEINRSSNNITTIPVGSYTRQEMHVIWKALMQCNTCEVCIIFSLVPYRITDNKLL